MSRASFYLQRDLRSQQFGLGEDFFDMPVRVVIGRQCVESPAGQSAALALVNMVSRLHRAVDLVVPSGALLVAPLAGGATFDEAANRLARRIDPFQQRGPFRQRPTVSIGLGGDAPSGLNWYAGGVGGAAILAHEPVPMEHGVQPSLAPSFAACLGAMALCRQVIGDRILNPIAIDVWEWTVAGAFTHPAPSGPLDVGDVLVVGAGGVGSCFGYWVRDFGHRSHWSVADGDVAELHNTNRCLGLFPDEAGWDGGTALNKAEVAGRVMSAQALPKFYDQLSDEEGRAQLVLPLANDREVRHLVGQRGDPVVLHATTSPAWEAQFHRHIPDLDDCICCRMPPARSAPRFKCSTAQAATTPDGESVDAALPFLSAAAGLMLVRGLMRLQHGLIRSTKSNLYSLRMRDARGPTSVSRFRCRDGCTTTPSPALRAIVQRGRMWAGLDQSTNAEVR